MERAVLLAALLGVTAPQEQYSEYVVKAGFLFNFAKYVEWPSDAFENATTPITIGIVGKDPFGETLEKVLKDKTANDRPFAVVRFESLDKYKDSKGRCHILFVAASEKERTKAVVAQAAASAVLTVGETGGFGEAGGMITILIQDTKPKLEINVEAAQQQKLVINSKLLKVATIVQTKK